MLLIGGHRDTVIPIEHTTQAHTKLPSSRLEIIDAAGHFPRVPQRLTRLLLDFLATTTPTCTDLESLRRQLRHTDGRALEPTPHRHQPHREPDS